MINFGVINFDAYWQWSSMMVNIIFTVVGSATFALVQYNVIVVEANSHKLWLISSGISILL